MYIKINVDQIKVFAYHGVYEEERLSGRYFWVDVELNVEADESGVLSDDLSATYNYELVTNIVYREMKTTAFLLEKKALEMANLIKNSDVKIQRVKLKLTKSRPPVKGEVGSVSVEVFV